MNKLQKVILEIFKEIKKLCETHDIPYYAIGGTCIGAVRHKGFIPWDDDLDIAIPIEDFDRFTECARRYLPSWLYVYSCDNIRHFRYIFIKICDKRTTFLEKNDYPHPDSFKGVFVDIMPISGVPRDNIRDFSKKIKRYNSRNFFLRFRDEFNSVPGFIYRIPFRLISLFRPDNYYSKQYVSLLKSYKFSEAEYTGYVWSINDLDKLIFPADWFKTYVELPFEDTMIRCPKEYDKYLTQQFGDYLKLPPMEQRISHNFYVDLEKPYIDYLNNATLLSHKQFEC